MCSKHVEAYNKLIIKKILCIKLVNCQDYTEMRGQQNVKECLASFEIIHLSLRDETFWEEPTHPTFLPNAYFQYSYSVNLNLKLNNKINLSYSLSCRNITIALVE